MSERKENMQRMQIGAFGLFSVMLLVGLASMANDKASNEVPVTDEIGITDSAADTALPDAPKEPLAELGAVPAPEPTPATKAK